MKPILNTEDIRKLKTDERLIECSCGKVNYYRFLCFHPRNTNYVILLNHCEDIIDGWCCQLCGVYFEEEHGYPVVCESCYNELSEEEKKDYQLATHKEF